MRTDEAREIVHSALVQFPKHAGLREYHLNKLLTRPRHQKSFVGNAGFAKVCQSSQGCLTFALRETVCVCERERETEKRVTLCASTVSTYGSLLSESGDHDGAERYYQQSRNVSPRYL
jgi:hypothetical protein